MSHIDAIYLGAFNYRELNMNQCVGVTDFGFRRLCVTFQDSGENCFEYKISPILYMN